MKIAFTIRLIHCYNYYKQYGALNMDRWLLRASKWARNPPSARQVRNLLIIIAICIAIALLEQIFGLTECIDVNRVRRGGH